MLDWTARDTLNRGLPNALEFEFVMLSIQSSTFYFTMAGCEQVDCGVCAFCCWMVGIIIVHQAAAEGFRFSNVKECACLFVLGHYVFGQHHDCDRQHWLLVSFVLPFGWA